MKASLQAHPAQAVGEALMGDDAYGVIAETMTASFRRSRKWWGSGSRSRGHTAAATSFAAWAGGGRHGPRDGGFTWNAGHGNERLSAAGRERRQGLKSRGSRRSISSSRRTYPGKAMRYLEEAGCNLRRRHRQPVLHDDTAAALGAWNMNVDIVVKATKVDGVYTTIPRPIRTRCVISGVSFDEAIVKKLKVMDATALDLVPRPEAADLRVSIFKRAHSNGWCSAKTKARWSTA